MTVDCPTCGDEFDTERGMKVHHGHIHGENIAGVERECANCGTATRQARWNVENYQRAFCSDDCLAEFRDKQVAVKCANCGTEYSVHRYRHERTERHFCDESCMGAWASENRHGPDNPNWRGGKSVYDAVKKALGNVSWETQRTRTREHGDSCRLCGGGGGPDQDLHAHHIIPILAGGSNHPDNLMLLCQPCHITVEHRTREVVDPVLVE
jgi:endogenous inhibitor of DNA gyrase (YacG/DUF329 family)